MPQWRPGGGGGQGLAGRKGLRQTNPRFFTGRFFHCGQWSHIARAVEVRDGGKVDARCGACKNKSSISIKKWGLVEVVDLCDSD